MRKNNVISIRIHSENKHKFYDYAKKNNTKVSNILNNYINEKISTNTEKTSITTKSNA